MDDITIRVINDDTVVIANDNTTIGYATFEKTSGTLSYIFRKPGVSSPRLWSDVVDGVGESGKKKCPW